MKGLCDFDLSVLFDSVPNAIFIKDETLHFVFINKAYEKMFNVKRENVIGKNVLELEYLSEQDRLFYQWEDTVLLNQGKVKHHVFEYLYQDKKLHTCLYHTCLYWSSGFVQPDGRRGIIGVIVDINRQTEMLQRVRDELENANLEKKWVEEKSKIDPLTQLYTRGTFDQALQEFSLPGKAGNGFSCIMLDIDHFKRVNDVFGHPAGDAVLQEAADIVQKCCRKRDLPCRYGGEEFVLLLYGSTLKNAVQLAERIRRSIFKHLHTPDGAPLSVSAGCSEYVPGESAVATVKRADEALYTAKNSGRNRVCALEAP